MILFNLKQISTPLCGAQELAHAWEAENRATSVTVKGE